jgi:hypothetical protein
MTGGNLVWITKCSTDKALVNFQNTSGCVSAGDSNNYAYYPGKLCRANAGSKVDLIVGLGYASGVTTSSITRLCVWVDWNHNGFFEVSQTYSEKVAFTAVNSNPTNLGNVNGLMTSLTATNYTFTFQVPTWAKNGPTRMRVRLAATGVFPSVGPSDLIQACDFNRFGDCEDYDFDVVNTCKAPKVLSISNVTCNSADICWSPNDYVDFYDYWVDTCKTPGCSLASPPYDPSIVNYFAPTSQNCVSLPNPKYPIGMSQLLPETKYYVTVRTTCDSIKKPTAQYFQNSGWDIVDSFTTLPCCDAPVNLKITNIRSTSATASWDPVYTSHMYE